MAIKEVTVCDYCKEDMPEAPQKRNIVLYEGISEIVEQNGMTIGTPIMVILGVSRDVCEKCKQKIRMGIDWTKLTPALNHKPKNEEEEQGEDDDFE